MNLQCFTFFTFFQLFLSSSQSGNQPYMLPLLSIYKFSFSLTYYKNLRIQFNFTALNLCILLSHDAIEKQEMDFFFILKLQPLPPPPHFCVVSLYWFCVWKTNIFSHYFYIQKSYLKINHTPPFSQSAHACTLDFD